MPSGYVLSESDARIIRELLEQYKQQLKAVPNRPFVKSLTPQTPGGYVCRVPGTGIPAKSGDRPGTAVCAVYRKLGALLIPAGFDLHVNSLSDTAISQDQYVFVERDKWGDWYAVACADCGVTTPPGTGTGSGFCVNEFAEFIDCCDTMLPVWIDCKYTKYCLELDTLSACACASGTVEMTYNATSGKIEGTAAYGSCGRSVTAKFYCGYDSDLAAKWLLDVSFSDGCDTQTLVSVSDPCVFPVLFDHTFEGNCGCGLTTVRYSFDRCPPTGTAPVTVPTVCCPDNLLPSTLHVTVDSSAECACASGSVALTYNSGTGTWDGTGAFGTCGRNVSFSLSCTDADIGGWSLTVSYSDGCNPPDALIAFIHGSTCSPLSLSFKQAFSGDCGCGLTDIHFLVTE